MEPDARAALRRRAVPIALALALVLLAGLVTDTVAAAQVLSLSGPTALSIIYPLSGVLLGVMALFQFTSIDSRPRLAMLRVLPALYGVAFLLALGVLALGIAPVVSVSAVWLLGDQIQLLLPVLLWSLAGDVFNSTEARKVFGWILVWTYVGQAVGIALATSAPLWFGSIGVPLGALLLANPLACIVIASWVPHRMRSEGASKGRVRRESLVDSVRGATSFLRDVPVWRALAATSTLAATASVLATLGFATSAESIIGSDADALQLVIAGTTLVVLVLCIVFAGAFSDRLKQRVATPSRLLVLPVVAVGAGLVLALGAASRSLVVLAVAMTTVGVAAWTVDDGSREEALTLVPDHLRARVSFVIDLGRYSVAQIIAGALAAIGSMLAMTWITGLLVSVVAAFAIAPGLFSRRHWDDSLLNWRLRRRKHLSVLDPDEWDDEVEDD